MSKKDIKVPNIGEFKDVEVIEVLIKKGQKIKKNDPLITIESDKSSVEIPSSDDGTIISLNVKIGDKVSEGDKIIEIESEKEIKETSVQELPKSQLPKEIKKNDVKTNESKNIIVKDFSSKASASPKVRKFAIANFLTFGEAEAFEEKSLTIIFLDSLVFTSFFFISFGN